MPVLRGVPGPKGDTGPAATVAMAIRGGVKGTPADGTLAYMLAEAAFTITAGKLKAGTGPTGSMVLTLKKNGSTAATLTTAPLGTTSGTISATPSFVAGDVIEITLATSAGAADIAYAFTGQYA